MLLTASDRNFSMVSFSVLLLYTVQYLTSCKYLKLFINMIQAKNVFFMEQQASGIITMHVYIMNKIFMSFSSFNW